MLSIFFGLGIANFSGAQTAAEDTERKTDINAIHVKFEEHYNEYASYPNLKELTEQGADGLPGIDPEALIDPNGKKIQDGEYTYSPSGCTATGCAHYKLSALLDDGTVYKKESLN